MRPTPIAASCVVIRSTRGRRTCRPGHRCLRRRASFPAWCWTPSASTSRRTDWTARTGGRQGRRRAGRRAGAQAHLGDLASYDHQRAQKTHAPAASPEGRRLVPPLPRVLPRRSGIGRAQLPAGRTALRVKEFWRGPADAYLHSAYDYGNHPHAAEAGYAALLASREHEKRLDGPAWSPGIPRISTSTEVRGDVPGASRRLGSSRPTWPRTSSPAATWSAPCRWPASSSRYAASGDSPRAGGLDRAGPWPVRPRPLCRCRARLPDCAWSATTDPARRSEIEERIAASIYKQAEAQRASGNNAAAVTEFLRVAAAAPDASIRPNAIFDAAALLMADKQWSRAVEVMQRFRREFPQHKFNSEITQQLAVALTESGRGAEAAREFENIAEINQPAGRRAARGAVAGGGALRQGEPARRRAARLRNAS